MNSTRRHLQRTRAERRRGAMLVLIGLCLPVVIAFGVFAIKNLNNVDAGNVLLNKGV